MGEEVVAAILGAVVGGLLAGGGAFIQHRWNRKDRIEESRLQLVREIFRLRRDQKALVGPLNEIALVFGHDEKAMQLCRDMMNAASPEATTRSLVDLINHLGRSVGLEAHVRPSDIDRGFTYNG